MNKQAQELIVTVTDILDKYEVTNEALAIELAIFVLQREKTAVRVSNEAFTNILRTA